VVLLRFSSAADPDLVVKVGGRVEREALGLRQLGPAARAAGARVPEALWSGRRGDVPVLAQTAVSGHVAARRLAGHRDRAFDLLEGVAAWLQRWNALSAEAQPLSRVLLERFVLAPAAKLASGLAVEGYVTRLERLCAACQGRTVRLVAAHNDLTAANLLLAEASPLGVIDWEESGAGRLPLGDLAYSIADAAAAVDRYRDRPAAFDACFAGNGGFADQAQRLITEAARDQELDIDIVELGMQACWLGHAANELDRSASDDSERPFLEILRRVAKRAVLCRS
jgi:hypothetical protein